VPREFAATQKALYWQTLDGACTPPGTPSPRRVCSSTISTATHLWRPAPSRRWASASTTPQWRAGRPKTAYWSKRPVPSRYKHHSTVRHAQRCPVTRPATPASYHVSRLWSATCSQRGSSVRPISIDGQSRVDRAAPRGGLRIAAGTLMKWKGSCLNFRRWRDPRLAATGRWWARRASRDLDDSLDHSEYQGTQL
jgi:hypothetical protein